MITVKDASIYTLIAPANSIAYQIVYSDDTVIRTVETKGMLPVVQYIDESGSWAVSNSGLKNQTATCKRNAEHIKNLAKDFLK